MLSLNLLEWPGLGVRAVDAAVDEIPQHSLKAIAWVLFDPDMAGFPFLEGKKRGRWVVLACDIVK